MSEVNTWNLATELVDAALKVLKNRLPEQLAKDLESQIDHEDIRASMTVAVQWVLDGRKA